MIPELPHLGDRADLEKRHRFVRPRRVAGGPVVRLSRRRELFAAIGVDHMDGALEYDAPVRARAAITRQPRQQGVHVGPGRHACESNGHLSPLGVASHELAPIEFDR